MKLLELVFWTVIFIIAFIFSFDVSAKSFSSIGLSTSYIVRGSSSYGKDYQFKPTITFSHFVDVKPLTIGYSTNRLDNWTNGYKNYNITYKKNGLRGVNQQMVTYDGFHGCKRYKRWLPCLFVANTRVKNKYYLNTRLVDNKVNHIWIKGLNVNYFLHKNISLSFSYLIRNKEIYLKEGYNLSVNYLF